MRLLIALMLIRQPIGVPYGCVEYSLFAGRRGFKVAPDSMVFIELCIPASENQVVLMVLFVFIVLRRIDFQGDTALRSSPTRQVSPSRRLE
nr:hypothetical protein [uncultured Pseudomonas sp.]